jgi:hypothetical protein
MNGRVTIEFTDGSFEFDPSGELTIIFPGVKRHMSCKTLHPSEYHAFALGWITATRTAKADQEYKELTDERV